MDTPIEDPLEFHPRGRADRLELLPLLADQDRLLAVAEHVDRLVDPHLAAVGRLGPALGLDRDAVGQLLVQAMENLLARDLGRQCPVREVRELVLRETATVPRAARAAAAASRSVAPVAIEWPRR